MRSETQGRERLFACRDWTGRRLCLQRFHWVNQTFADKTKQCRHPMTCGNYTQIIGTFKEVVVVAEINNNHKHIP